MTKQSTETADNTKLPTPKKPGFFSKLLNAVGEAIGNAKFGS